MENLSSYTSRKFGVEVSIARLLLILYPLCLIPVALGLYFQRQRRTSKSRSPEGCTRLGIRHQSNLADEYDDEKYAKEVSSDQRKSQGSDWKVKAIFIYPIKSCAPVELEAVDLDASGLRFDREFAFAEIEQPPSPAGDPEKPPIWTFRTLRRPGFEKLALVRPEIWLPESRTSDQSHCESADSEGVLVVKYPNSPSGPLAGLDRLFISLGLLPKERSFQVPLVPPKNHNYPIEDVVIWKDTPKWLNYGIHVPQDFKKYVGAKKDLSLFRVDPDNERNVFRCAPRKEKLGFQPLVGFADGYPIHLLNLASVRDLAAKVKKDIPKFSSRRFRANLLITGPPAYDEDDWKRARIGEHVMYCACHTVRCRLPNVDPETAIRHPHQPDKMLKSFRCIDDGDPNNACLGLQLVPGKEEGIHLRVGDRIEILERGEHHYIPQGK